MTTLTKTTESEVATTNFSPRLRDLLSSDAVALYDHILTHYPEQRTFFSMSPRCPGEIPFRYLVRSVIEGTTDSKMWSKRVFTDSEIAESINDADQRIAAYNLLIDKSSKNWAKAHESAKVNRRANWQIIRGAVAFAVGFVILFF